jgi:hypothetical protein
MNVEIIIKCAKSMNFVVILITDKFDTQNWVRFVVKTFSSPHCKEGRVS